MFPPKATLLNFAIRHRLEECTWSVPDFLSYQGNHSQVLYKAFPFAYEVLFIQRKKKDFPDGIQFLTAAFKANPDFKVAKLHQDVLLSYMGNGAKEELQKHNWNPNGLLEIPVPENPRAALLELMGPAEKALMETPWNYAGSRPLTLKEWLTRYFEDYGWDSLMARKIFISMFQAGAAFPENMSATAMTMIRKYANVDETTRLIIDPAKPAPTKPVEVTPAAEKKEESPSVSQPEKPLPEPAVNQDIDAAFPIAAIPTTYATVTVPITNFNIT